MLLLSDDISKTPKIGPRYKSLLNKMNISTILDMLYHFPFRYEDRSNIKKISNLQKGEKAVVIAKISSVKNIFTKNEKKITKGVAMDDTGEVQLIWFNMHYISRNIRVGETYLIYGKVEEFEKKNTFIVPETELYEKEGLHMGRIVPIYPTTEGISTKWIRTRINDLLNGAQDNSKLQKLEEFLPKEIIDKRRFLDWENSIKSIHFPEEFCTLEKARERLAYEELFIELYQSTILEKKWKSKKNAMPLIPREEGKIIEEFISNLPFELTQSQNIAIKDILADLEKPYSMNRLLEGDVGTGKTIVAIIAAYQAILNNTSVLCMAPTEILAQQHFETFKRFLEPLGIETILVTRVSKNKKGNIDKKAQPQRRKPHVQIGTHALLYQQEKLENIGLVIIDEQHRFGVEQRTQLLRTSEKTTPHLLTMTATPIPRTLALTLYGDLDISVLKDHPNKERKIITKVVPTSKQKEIYEFIAKQNMSAFIVCPFIEESRAENLESIKAATAEFAKLKEGVFVDQKCALLHGKMTFEEKAKIIGEFRSGKIKVLVSTPVIEVGIDVPDADVMVIESAERYGLASLHQLRGRVGRGSKKGYCFVFPTNYSKKAYSRLKYLEETLDGLKLAEIDLRLRGQGDIFGKLQHGFLDFKLADITDLDFVKMVREDVNEIVDREKRFPLLENFLEIKKGAVGQN